MWALPHYSFCFPAAWMDFTSTVWSESVDARGRHMRAGLVISGRVTR